MIQSDYSKILTDPIQLLLHQPTSSDHSHPTQHPTPTLPSKLHQALVKESINLDTLRSLAWTGIPNHLRLLVWQLLLSYLPPTAARRATTLARKRQEYKDAIRLTSSTSSQDQQIKHQILIDCKRTCQDVAMWREEGAQERLGRILYLWAVRHPASGYVQGINDLAIPFFTTFLSAYLLPPLSSEILLSQVPEEILVAVEADTFWCLTSLLSNIQSNYIYAQPGISTSISTLSTLCARVDAPLSEHLKTQGIEFHQFSFRWFNCLLMRELPLHCIIRMWDTYLSEESQSGFSEFHLYVCLAFLVKWSKELREMDFQEGLIFLQGLPTGKWGEEECRLLLSEGFMWSRTFCAR